MLFLILSLVATAGAVPQFLKNYHATGTVSLPYAEIKEPFEAWFSQSLNKSRIDVYGGMVKNVVDVVAGASYKVAHMTNETATNVLTCFETKFDAGDEVDIQGILPDTSLGFENAGTAKINGVDCDKWVYSDTPNGTHLTQTYTLYTYNESPVQFVMEGYNIISGSHVDKYVIDYSSYSNGDNFTEEMFSEPYSKLDCGGYPGPGHAGLHSDIFADIMGGVHDHESNFKDFKEKYEKMYGGKEEHCDRFAAYRNNIRYIHSKNRQGLSYKLGENHMVDWFPHEHRRLRGKLYSGEPNNGRAFNKHEMKYQELPTNFDLRVQGAIGPVKDQAICGSCWSFATTGSIEGAFFTTYGYRISLSEQNLMDCSWGYGNNACDGGEEWRAYEWMMKHGGIAYEEEYGPYLMADGLCHYEQTRKRVQITSYTNVTGEEPLMMALFNKGAVAVNIDASHKSLSFYESGVYFEPDCKNGPEDLDHAVLAVGWGTLGGEPYWIVKNSWSTHWGNVGYVLMSRRNNNCGVTTDATYVEVA